MLEFETRGIPTAYISAATRVPMVEYDGDGIKRTDATGNYLIQGLENSGLQPDNVHRRPIHFGVHGRMRLSHVKEGDRIHYRGKELRWNILVRNWKPDSGPPYPALGRSQRPLNAINWM